MTKTIELTLPEKIAFDQACDIAEIRFINAGLPYPKERVEFSIIGILKEKGIQPMFEYVRTSLIKKKMKRCKKTQPVAKRGDLSEKVLSR